MSSLYLKRWGEPISLFLLRSKRFCISPFIRSDKYCLLSGLFLPFYRPLVIIIVIPSIFECQVLLLNSLLGQCYSFRKVKLTINASFHFDIVFSTDIMFLWHRRISICF